MKNLTAADQAKLTPLLSRAAVGHVLALRAEGAPIADAKRDALLAKARAGEYVELEIDLLAFEQKTGERNRNFIRFREASMAAFGRSGRQTPFLRDHEQGDILARGGTVVASATRKGEAEEGHYRLEQTAKVTAPWAVEALLRGHIDRFSIGWTTSEPPHCSVCDQSWLLCAHWPGDRLEAYVGDDGAPRYRRSATGQVVVELIYQNAELVETSAVSVPAVPSAQIEGIRAAMSAHVNGGEEPQENQPVKHLAKILSILTLAPTAGEDEVLTAVEGLAGVRAELKVVTEENKKLSASIEEYRAKELATAENDFIRDAIAEGKLAAGDDASWRELFKANQKRARELMAERKPGIATPVGQPRQSGAPTPATAAGGSPLARLDALAKKIAGEERIPYAAAYDKAVCSVEGQQLYTEYRAQIAPANEHPDDNFHREIPMATQKVLQNLTLRAGADLSAAQYLFVELSAAQTVTVCNAITDDALGVLQNDPAVIGQEAVVGFLGTTKVVAGAAIAMNANVAPMASGKAQTAASTQKPRGKALEAAAADGDVIEIALFFGGVPLV